jgi:uncharacterized protein (DUF1501 family)
MQEHERKLIKQREVLDCPTSVPWDLVGPHERQALRNHSGQTLVRLAERGGLSPDELVAVLEDRKWTRMEPAEAITRLKEIVRVHLTMHPPWEAP